jgi:hypothetical protein
MDVNLKFLSLGHGHSTGLTLHDGPGTWSNGHNDGTVWISSAHAGGGDATGTSNTVLQPGDHSSDYIGSTSDGVHNLTAPGTIYPGFKYGVYGVVDTHSQGSSSTMLHVQPADHTGAIYCS